MIESNSNALRAFVVFQLAATVVALTIVMLVKHKYYFTARKYVTMILLGMIGLCVYGAGAMMERMGQPIGWRAGILFAATALINVGLVGAFVRNKVNSNQ